MYLVFTHPKHLQPLITAHLNVNWLNYSRHPLDTLSPLIQLCPGTMDNERSDAALDLFAQLPGVTHSQPVTLSRGCFTAGKVSCTKTRIGPHTLWGSLDLCRTLTPNTRCRVCHSYPYPTGSQRWHWDVTNKKPLAEGASKLQGVKTRQTLDGSGREKG